MIFALAGNQNCGKTTLFNALTGSNQHVGNFPGVTVDKKSGDVRGVKNCEVVDLPGIYSIRPYTQEEIVTRDFIIDEKPDGIINIVDATAIERNLYLTLQLLELGLPMVIALNMMDEVRANGTNIDINVLSETLGVPVVPISAAKNEGITELIKVIYETAETKTLPKVRDFCEHGPVHRSIHAVSHLIEDHAEKLGIAPRFAGVKVIEGDEDLISRLSLNQNELDMIEHSIVEMENERGLDRNAAIADMRYNFIEMAAAKAVTKRGESKAHIRSQKIDRVLTNKFLAIPLFIGILLLVFWLSFGVIGGFLSRFIDIGIVALTNAVDRGLTAYGINHVVKSLIVDGIFKGIGTVLGCLPLVVTLFLFLSILEDSGYMARIAFVMDKPLKKIGLSGRSLVPMIIGFGCTVPAIMSARTLSSDRDRKLTIMMIPFMSCSAKIPVYALFASVFFPKYRALVMIMLYLFGIIIGIIISIILGKTAFRGGSMPFVMELPNYRLPSIKTTARLLWDKAKDFLERAFTVIFLASIVIWFLRSFDLRLNYVTNSELSILSKIGGLIAPIFAPLGFGNWKTSTALISGVMAKEAVVSTLGILSEGGNAALSLPAMFGSTAAAASFLVFTLLYTPCVAAIATLRKELNSRINTVAAVIFQCAVAWVFAFLTYFVLEIVL